MFGLACVGGSGLQKRFRIDAGLSKLARRVPFGMSPGWFGTVVYRFLLGLNQISAAGRLPIERETQSPKLSGDAAIPEPRKPAHQAATTMV